MDNKLRHQCQIGFTLSEPLPIYNAAVYGDFALVTRLLDEDQALVNAADEWGFTPLHGVAGEDQPEMAKYLLAKGANVNARNDAGITPLHLAAYPSVAKLLVEAGASLEAREGGQGTPLHVLSESDDRLDVIEALLELGADVNARDGSGRTALDTAEDREDPEMIALLTRYGGLRGVQP
ncbi:ankyrin repeat domain-containing protein [Variovorax sp. J22G73]|uniref:ankyrin repeat domain-containing protein n=1 Tax=unclassified Variovorax TaxID=663243 RepID=UPI002578979A|nr:MULTISPECIES: ankyrin repeat domain-containing protein [unclassified Variovorax]MDM0008388.1 ankyrin repeat domain-containing protein [Variovorax sp. J22R203]MDM0100895.1 ankyrin repeat domain-containing protein [Variovorax sp. J22G73]